MAQIAWTRKAERWLSDIHDYIADDNPVAAMETVEGIHERAQSLAQFPSENAGMAETIHEAPGYPGLPTGQHGTPRG